MPDLQESGPVRAPWTDEQVANIRSWQALERFHGLTCEVHSDDLLDVDNACLSCRKCSYTQDWVPAGLAGRRAPEESGTVWSGFAGLEGVDSGLHKSAPRRANDRGHGNQETRS